MNLLGSHLTAYFRLVYCTLVQGFLFFSAAILLLTSVFDPGAVLDAGIAVVLDLPVLSHRDGEGDDLRRGVTGGRDKAGGVVPLFLKKQNMQSVGVLICGYNKEDAQAIKVITGTSMR